MGNYVFSRSAKLDLKSIYFYTFETWGERQLTLYAEEMDSSLLWLSENPFTIESKERFDLYPACYFYHVGKHFIVYRYLNDCLEIARILHESMDFESQLKPIHFKFD